MHLLFDGLNHHVAYVLEVFGIESIFDERLGKLGGPLFDAGPKDIDFQLSAAPERVGSTSCQQLGVNRRRQLTRHDLINALGFEQASKFLASGLHEVWYVDRAPGFDWIYVNGIWPAGDLKG